MIKHILKDGTVVDSINGHVIKAKENKVLYEIINRIQRNEPATADEKVLSEC